MLRKLLSFLWRQTRNAGSRNIVIQLGHNFYNQQFCYVFLDFLLGWITVCTVLNILEAAWVSEITYTQQLLFHIAIHINFYKYYYWLLQLMYSARFITLSGNVDNIGNSWSSIAFVNRWENILKWAIRLTLNYSPTFSDFSYMQESISLCAWRNFFNNLLQL